MLLFGVLGFWGIRIRIGFATRKLIRMRILVKIRIRNKD
jgi:hypothetical protein